MDLSLKLQELRKKSQLSQEELAEKLDVSRQSISKWEAGQVSPEIKKIILLSEIFNVSTDYLLKDGPEDAEWVPNAKAEKARSNKKILIISIILGFALIASIFAISRLAMQNQKLSTEIVVPTVNVSSEPEKTTPEQYEELGKYYFDFSRANRFDYVPYFTENNAPTESPDYLFWAFAINLDNWGDDKGVMSKGYVEEMIAKHFKVTGISHLSMRKSWNYDGEKYTAMPQGIRELPIYILKEYSTRMQNGIQVYEVILDNCGLANGMIPNEEDIENIKSNITNDMSNELILKQREKITYSQSFDGPVFLSHVIVGKEE